VHNERHEHRQPTVAAARDPITAPTSLPLAEHAFVAPAQPDQVYSANELRRPIARTISQASVTSSKSGYFSRHSARHDDHFGAITAQLTSMLQSSLKKSQETTANSLQFAAHARNEARHDLHRIVAYERQLAEAKAEKTALELRLENKILHLQLECQHKTPPDTVVMSVSIGVGAGGDRGDRSPQL